MKLSTKIGHVAATIAIAAGLTVAGAPAAQAAPWNCPVSGAGVSRSTICYQGSGEYRIAIFCINNLTLSSTGRTIYGPWISTSYSRPSAAWCAWYERVGSAFPQTR